MWTRARLADRARVRCEVTVVLSVDTDESAPASIGGRLESRYGQQTFSGWLELFGELEELVDRARDEARDA